MRVVKDGRTIVNTAQLSFMQVEGKAVMCPLCCQATVACWPKKWMEHAEECVALDERVLLELRLVEYRAACGHLIP